MESKKNSSSSRARRSPITTAEARDNEMINLAYAQAELQLLNGTAPAPIVSYFLQLKSDKTRLSEEKLRRENALLEKQLEEREAAADIRALYQDAMIALTEYKGEDVVDEEDYYYED